MRIILLATLCLTAACAAPTRAPHAGAQALHPPSTPPPAIAPSPYLVEELNGPIGAAIHQVMIPLQQRGFAGAVIAEVHGRTVLAAGYGLADRTLGAPFTTRTIAQIGSITKPFTATAVAQLAADGRLDLDAPASRYLPTASLPAARATIRQLLTHTSGMSEYCGQDLDRATLDHVLHVCMASPLKAEPGMQHVYSNPGYSVLAAVIEAVSGQTFEDYMRASVLEPNGMHDTGVLFPDAPPGRLAHGYLNDVDQGTMAEHLAALNGAYWNLKGNGGMEASARDMLRWKHVLAGEGALSAQTRALQLTPPRTDTTENQEGLGWILQVDARGQLIKVTHSGSDGTCYAFFFWRPSDDTFIYLVGNDGEAISREAAQSAGHALLAGVRDTPASH